MKIGIIGGGNMAASLLGGLIADGFDAGALWISDPHQEKLDAFAENFKVNTSLDNNDVVKSADVLLFAVKPQVLCSVAKELAKQIQLKKSLVISIAAGIRVSDLERWVGGDAAIVRCMPNTPALIGSAMTGMFANELVTEEQRNTAESILRAVGLTLWLEDEKSLNAVTALSGSGPAYFFLVMEALEHAGEIIGLSRDEARILTLQTALGASRMALESGEPLARLRERVTSPGGVTERALRALEVGGLRHMFTDALYEANKRADEITLMLGQQK